MPQPADVAVPLEALSETELVALLRRGHAPAFRAAVQRNNRRLYRLARSVLRDDAEAEDAVQEAYLRAFRALDGFKGDSSFSAWLTRITLNEALGRLRRRPPPMIDETRNARSDDTGRVIPFPLAHAAADPAPDPEHAAAAAEIRRLLEAAIDELPEPFRVVFVLREIEQMSTAETAACLGAREDTVKTRLHRAKRLLRVLLEERLAETLHDAFPFDGARCARMADTVLERLGLEAPPPSG